ncbi:hypothetical protein AMQ83_08645 [Paenibacillus riograndensis]|nr:hypothetical protein AMQ83_08645 [Paenibacillus riograndensis]
MGLDKWLFAEESIDEETFRSVESTIGVTYPRDYEECVKKYNGGYPKPNKFDLHNGVQAIFMGLISFTNENLNITMFSDFAEESSVEGLVPFGRDPFGNLLCFDYRLNKTSPKVIFFDHEATGEEAIITICNTFTELLDGLYSIE